MRDIRFPSNAILRIPVGPGSVRTENVNLRMLHRSVLDRDPPGGEQSAAEFLLPPEVEPIPGAELEVDGRVYTIASVRECRDLDGIPVAFRCAVR